MNRFLVVGYSTELTIEHFLKIARERDAEFDVCDLSRLGKADRLDIEFSGGNLSVLMDDQVFDFSKYCGFYTRAYCFPTGHDFYNRVLEKLVGSIEAYLETCDQIVLNRPSAIVSNTDKFAHAAMLQEFGFTIPFSVVIGNANRAEEVLTREDAWVSKAVSSLRSESMLVDENLRRRFHLLDRCPSQFQRLIAGPDVRVHVVGSSVFGVMIESHGDRVDYRFPAPGDEAHTFSPIQVPATISKLCVEFCQMNRVGIAGFDFKMDTEQSQWYLLEVNPMPGYDYYDHHLDEEITIAMLELLRGGAEAKFKSDAGANDEEHFISPDRLRPTTDPDLLGLHN